MIPIIIKSKKKNRNNYRKTKKYINKGRKTKKYINKRTKKQLGGHQGAQRRHTHTGASHRAASGDWQPRRFNIYPVDGRVCMLIDRHYGIYRPAPHIEHVHQDMYGPIYPPNEDVVVHPTELYQRHP